MIRTLSIVGARPQFVKLAPVSRAMATSPDRGGVSFEDVIVHTGQHYDPGLSDIFFSELEIPRPDIDLEIGSGQHGEQTGRMLAAIESVINERQPDVVVVYGDTNSTLAGALAAAKLHVPIAHIEAGLRSFDRRMPEEVNRIVSDHVADVLYAPTRTAMKNLAEENLADRSRLVGDVMLDAVIFNRGLSIERSDIVSRMGLDERGYMVATLHRAANTDSERLRVLLDSLQEAADRHLPVIFPVHPRTVARIDSDYPEWRPSGQLRLIDPVGYLDMIRLVDSAAAVLTDSGGLQKEAFFLGVPCLTLRDETEWTETVEGGGNTLVGADREKIAVGVQQVLENVRNGKVFDAAAAQEFFGDGLSAEKITSDLGKFIAA